MRSGPVNKVLPAVVFAALLLLALVGAAYAARGVTYDTYVDVNGAPTDNHAAEVNMYAAGSESVCTPSQAALVQWDLASITTGTVQTVTLSFNSSFAFATSGAVLGLYPASSSWNDSTNNGALLALSLPVTGIPALATTPAPTAASQIVVFTGVGPTNPLVMAAQTAVNTHGKLSFSVQLMSNCVAGGASVVGFTQGTGSVSLDLVNPTAVTLSTFRAADSPFAWPLIGGAMGLAVFLTLMLLWGIRRRSAM